MLGIGRLCNVRTSTKEIVIESEPKIRLHLLSEEEQKTAIEGELRSCPKCMAEDVFYDGEWQCLNPDCDPTFHKDYHAS